MGRRQYIQRLALGRSAFEDILEEAPGRVNSGAQHLDGYDDHVQQYDAKGRPIDPNIEAFNADQRKAKNEILELVGVVERKDQLYSAHEFRYKIISKHRQTSLAEENDRGELLEYVTIPASFFCHLWPSAFRQRIQIGYYDASQSMADILTSEWNAMWRGGTRWSLATRFPALGDPLSHVMLRLPAILAVEQVTGRIQKWIGKKRFSRPTRDFLFHGVAALFEALLLGIDIAMLPMEFHAAAQRLGLAPVLPLLPPLSSVLPWRHGSFHSYGWKPLLNIPFLRSFSSPAALLLLQKMMRYDTDDTSVPILSLLTEFRYPVINEDDSKIIAPTASKDPIGWLLYKCYKIRTSFLHFTGWNLLRRDEIRRTRENDFENNTVSRAPAEGPLPIHRSTTLAHLPVQFLAQAIDTFLSRLIVLPFESLMLRAIAATYLSTSTTTKSTIGLLATPRLYAPFSGSPLLQVLRTPNSTNAWISLGEYASRLGLSLALTAAVETILFFGVYQTVQRLGKKSFHWGKKGRIGSIAYTPDEMNET